VTYHKVIKRKKVVILVYLVKSYCVLKMQISFWYLVAWHLTTLISTL